MTKSAIELETAAQIETENFTLSPKILHYNLPEQITELKAENLQNTAAISNDLKPAKANKSCAVHTEVSAFYSCESCAESFCKACPKTYGSVKICPFCGTMCKSLAETVQKQKQLHQFENAAATGFGFADFAKSVAYPFKFKASLNFGAVFFTIFWLGQSVWIFGGFMLVSAIFCAMLANTLTFRILANTVENFSNGKTESDFMPRFDDFSAWDDVIHPFLLSIDVYIISAVAAYTRSFTATLNPLIGFDTIKRLGFDYAKILGVSLILGIFAIVLNSILGTVFAPLDLPQIGNLAVKAFDGLLYFYYSIVFSVVLGFAIYKNSRSLNLLRG